MSLLATLFPELAEWPGWAMLFGVLLGLGGFVSLIIGMLYRIVPFLVWLHLQEHGACLLYTSLRQGSKNSLFG